MKNLFILLVLSLNFYFIETHAKSVSVQTIETVCAFHGVEYYFEFHTTDYYALCPIASQEFIDSLNIIHDENDDVHNEECYSWWHRN